jgi:hypothetical protein
LYLLKLFKYTLEPSIAETYPSSGSIIHHTGFLCGKGKSVLAIGENVQFKGNSLLSQCPTTNIKVEI